MDYRPRHIMMPGPIMITVTHPGHDLYMTFSRESYYYPILRTLQCCGLLFKIVGEELVHYKCLQIWPGNASELQVRGASGY